MFAAASTPAGAAVDFQREDLAAGGNVTEIGIGDLDGQHGPDIVTSLYAGGISVRLNNGDGTFVPPVVYPTAGCAPVDLALGDVTGDGTDLFADGKLDVAVACDNAQIGRMAGDGAGGLGALKQRSGSSIGNSGTSFLSDHIALVRWRDPGLPPVLLFQVFAYDFSVFRNYPTLCVSYDWSTGEACQASSANAAHVFGGPIVTGDVNGVGIDEVVGVGGPEGVQILGLGGMPLSYSWSDRQFGASAASGTPSIAIGDLAADGFPDIVTSSSNSSFGKVNVLHGDSSGLPNQVPDTVPSAPGLSQVAIGDFDGDGKGDVLGATGYGRAVVLAGDVDGNLGVPQNVPLIGFGNPAFATSVLLATADLDGNGGRDAVVVDRGSQVVEVLRNQNATLAPPGGGGGGPGPSPIPPPTPPTPPAPLPTVKPPLSGLTGLKSAVTATTKGGLVFGTGANPPTKAVSLALTVPGSSSRARKAKPRPRTIGSATIRIPTSAKRSLALRLGKTGRSMLQRNRTIKATLTLRATGTDGATATKTVRVTLRRATKH